MPELFTLSSDNRREQAELMQASLVDLIDLALILKQAHWNLAGPGFIAVHEQLDAIIDDAREGSDAIAERMVTLGHAANGSAGLVAGESRLPAFPGSIVSVDAAVEHAASALHSAIAGLRQAIQRLGELDPITEDLFIATASTLEKHHWMLRANRETPADRAGLG